MSSEPAGAYGSVVTNGTARPRLLYVSAVAPALTGGGPAMRAGAVVRALARFFEVTLLVTAGHGDRAGAVPGDIEERCKRVVLIGAGETLSRRERFDIVHVFGPDALPDAAPWLRWATERHIDLDDLESLGGHRLASLALGYGRSETARQAEERAERARLLEDDVVARFDRVYVCSEAGRQALLKRNEAGADVMVLPNSLPLPAFTPFPAPGRGPFSLLFTGTLSRADNEDAMLFFCTDILPRIQAGADRLVTLRIVGAGAGPAIQRLDGQAGVEVIGATPEMAPWYRDAHLVVAPVRAGGGTRFKVLEAFAWRRPVVATSTGMEGIAAEDGRHAYIADDPARFAADCLRLLHDPELAARMADDAFALFSREHSEDVLATVIAESLTRLPTVARDA